MNKYIVKFICNDYKEHNAPYLECNQVSEKEFLLSERDKMLSFVDSCTKVLNLDELLGVAKLNDIKDLSIFNNLESL